MWTKLIALLLVYRVVCQMPQQPRYLLIRHPSPLYYSPNRQLQEPGIVKYKTAGPRVKNFFKKSNSHLPRYLEPPDAGSFSNYEAYALDFEDEEELKSFPKNHRPDFAAIRKKKKRLRDDRPPYVRDHEPVALRDSSPEPEVAEKSVAKIKEKNSTIESLELSPDGDRVEFQVQNHEGPKTYVFGFDTGDGKNRQFRLEEKFRDGTVKGHYGYYDARGKLRAIKYIARPQDFYEEKHHESKIS